MRVLSISHGALTRTGGRVRYQRLQEIRTDVKVTIVVPNRWREYGKLVPCDPHDDVPDFRVENVRFPSVPLIGWYGHYYPNLTKIVEEVRPDVIHAWEEPWSVVGFQAIRVRDRVLPSAAVILETDQNIFRALPPPFQQLRAFNLKRTDLLIGRSEEAVDVSRKWGFSGPSRVVEYAVATETFFPRSRDAARNGLDLSGFVIGYVGRLVPEKGLIDVLQAVARCMKPVTLLVVGEGSEAEVLISYAEKNGIANRLRIMPSRPASEIAEVMSAMDALILMSRTTPTWKEQFGRVIMEAQACRVPVIGSDSGSIPDVIGEGGWVVPEGDSASLAQLLDWLYINPVERDRAAAFGP